MPKNVVVTGSSGYIGSHVVAEIARHPEHFALVEADLHKSSNSDTQFVEIDLLKDAEDEDLYERLGKPDICVHLAWRNGFDHNAVSHLTDLPSHFLFLKNLADHGTTQFAVAGSFREYGKVSGMVDHSVSVVPDNLYSLGKTALKHSLEIYFSGKDTCLQWLRPFTVYGDDERNNSIMSKILRWEREGKETFPFTDGSEEYDYIHVDELSRQITAIIAQKEIAGVIDCCSGKPTRIGDKIEEFIRENNLHIRPEYGAFPSRSYDSSVIYGDRTQIDQIMKTSKIYRGERK